MLKVQIFPYLGTFYQLSCMNLPDGSVLSEEDSPVTLLDAVRCAFSSDLLLLEVVMLPF